MKRYAGNRISDKINFSGGSGIPLLFTLFVMLIVSGCSGPVKKVTITEKPSPGIRQYNELGRTGLKVSDIGFGAGSTTDPAVIRYALDLGINYFDTAESYAGGRSERAIGEVAAGRREEMIICTKLDMNGNTKQEEIFTRLDGCLERLQTDYCDILMIHAGNRDAVNNPEIYSAFDQLKKDGKIRFTGVSHHGPNLAEELRPIIEKNKVDVILCSWDPFDNPGLPEILEVAHEKGIGIVGMKMFSSAKKADLEEFESGKYPFHISALRWALKTSTMQTLIPSMNFYDQVDEYISVSGAGQE